MRGPFVWPLVRMANGWLAGGDRSSLKIWNLDKALFASHKVPVRMFELPAGAEAIAFSLNGRWLAVTTSNGVWAGVRALRVYDMNDFSEVKQARRRFSGIARQVRFNPDSNLLAVALGEDEATLVMEVGRWRDVARLPIKQRVRAITFSKDGRWLATASDDRTAHIWSVGDWQEKVRLVHEHKVYTVAFYENDRRVLTGGENGLVKSWHWHAEDFIPKACGNLSRNLSPTERRKYMFSRSQKRITCPGHPVPENNHSDSP